MYREVNEQLKKIIYILGFDNVTVGQINEIEHLLFELRNEGYFEGMENAYSDHDSRLLEIYGIDQKI